MSFDEIATETAYPGCLYFPRIVWNAFSSSVYLKQGSARCASANRVCHTRRHPTQFAE